jgi:hypothetical protein
MSSVPADSFVRKFAAAVLSDRRYPLILTFGTVLLCWKVIREVGTHDMAYLYPEYLANYQFDPTVLVMDVEGAEHDLLASVRDWRRLRSIHMGRLSRIIDGRAHLSEKSAS